MNEIPSAATCEAQARARETRQDTMQDRSIRLRTSSPMPEQKISARIARKVLPETATLGSDGFASSWRSGHTGPSFHSVTIEDALVWPKVLAVPGKRFAHAGERPAMRWPTDWETPSSFPHHEPERGCGDRSSLCGTPQTLASLIGEVRPPWEPIRTKRPYRCFKACENDLSSRTAWIKREDHQIGKRADHGNPVSRFRHPSAVVDDPGHARPIPETCF